jgi:hypothetical protein
MKDGTTPERSNMKKNKTRVWTLRRPRRERDPRPDGATGKDRASEQQAPDDAAAGRDRLSENERQPMDPGVSDSDHA